MIGNTLAVPAGKNRSARFGVADLTDAKKFPAFSAINLREDGNGFVAAEGTEFVADAPEGTEEIYAALDKCFAYVNGEMYTIADGKIAGKSTVRSLPNELGHYFGHATGSKIGIVTDTRFLNFTHNGSTLYGGSIGGSSFTVINDRIFSINGLQLQYSDWFDNMEDFGLYKSTASGIIDLPDFAGKGLKLVGRNGFAYLILEHDIWKLELLSDPLNFKIKEYQFSLDTVHEKSVADCGSHIYFCTTRGLVSFDGSKCKPVECDLIKSVDFLQPVYACRAEGRYYASVAFKGKGRGMLVYDDLTKRAYRLDISTTHFNAWHKLHYLTAQGKIYRFTGKNGFPAGSSVGCGILETGKFRPFEKGRFVLHAITVEGVGHYVINATAEVGGGVEGMAGNRLIFKVPPRGETLSLRIDATSPGTRLEAITLEFREVENE